MNEELNNILPAGPKGGLRYPVLSIELVRRRELLTSYPLKPVPGLRDSLLTASPLSHWHHLVQRSSP